MAKIIYTKVDEAPQLAAASLLPIIERFLSEAGIEVETRDISLAGRVLDPLQNRQHIFPRHRHVVSPAP